MSDNEHTTVRIVDIARMAGVSVATVDRVIHNRGKVSEENLARINEVLRRVDYRPNLIARSLASGRRYTLCAVMPRFAPGEYWADFEAGIARAEAEAKAHENLGEGIRLLNEFMNNYRIVGGGYDCTNMSSSVENFTNELMLQKRIEFWGEGIVMFDMKRLDMSTRRGYVGTNSPASYRLNTEGRAPYWNFVISRGETQNNPVIATQNNPDPSQTVKPWNG